MESTIEAITKVHLTALFIAGNALKRLSAGFPKNTKARISEIKRIAMNVIKSEFNVNEYKALILVLNEELIMCHPCFIICGYCIIIRHVDLELRKTDVLYKAGPG